GGGVAVLVVRVGGRRGRLQHAAVGAEEHGERVAVGVDGFHAQRVASVAAHNSAARVHQRDHLRKGEVRDGRELDLAQGGGPVEIVGAASDVLAQVDLGVDRAAHWDHHLGGAGLEVRVGGGEHGGAGGSGIQHEHAFLDGGAA